ncbi:hypothetical protein [Tissierella praeacuta]|uniref:hypothetical protein n=1 Tax=Tissierella praeacuta TaxID=43131 RepID=UPI00333F466F
MKTWEMIKELSENPEKKFKAINNNYPNDENSIITSVGNGDIVFEKANTGILAVISLGTVYEEVKEPVSFIEAVKALNSGKTIYVKHGEEFEYTEMFSPAGSQTDWGYAMKQQQGYAIDTGLILYGEWYIE